MKSLRPHELKDLIHSPAFEAWYGGLKEVDQKLAVATARHRELTTQADFALWRADRTQAQGDEKVYDAGAAEETAGEAGSTVTTIENDSFEALSSFETQRQRATDTWSALGAAEQDLEDARERVSELQAQLTAREKAGDSGGERDRLHGAFDEANRQRDVCVEAATRLAKSLEIETAKRDELWRKVERDWSSSFVAAMAWAEHSFRAKKIRRESEELFEKAQQERARAAELSQQAIEVKRDTGTYVAERDRLVAQACTEFECVSSGTFLFWPSANDMNLALCVSLVEELRHLKIQLAPLMMCQIARSAGLDSIEPIAEKARGGDDPRLNDFFERKTVP